MLVIGMVEEARVAGIDVRVVPDMYDGLAWNARVEYIGQFPTIPLHRRDFPIGGILVKRMLDITVSSLALVVGAPVMLAIAIAVRMDSEGQTLYKAHRIGRKGRSFTCYKFPHNGAERRHDESRSGAYERAGWRSVQDCE